MDNCNDFKSNANFSPIFDQSNFNELANSRCCNIFEYAKLFESIGANSSNHCSINYFIIHAENIVFYLYKISK